MIRFKVGSELYEFHGAINVTTTAKYLFEKRDPFNPALFYRYGKYYQDSLEISMVCYAEEYESLYYAIADILTAGEDYIVGWETVTGYQYRRLTQLLVYPSEVRFIGSEVSLRLESEPYDTIQKVMQNLTSNQIWNESTIANTTIAYAFGGARGGGYEPPLPELISVDQLDTLSGILLTGDFNNTIILSGDNTYLLHE